MKQTINNGQLAAIVTHILTNPFSGELDDQSAFEQFVTKVAQLVCDNCGGQLVSPARYAPEPDNMDWTTHYRLEVQTTLASPEDGGIWAKSLARPETNVSIEPVQGKVYGVRESLYWIDSH